MNLRSRLSTLIAARVVIGTLLLGSAIMIQISRPGAFPVDPFFALIGLTYALSVLYLATLRFAERHNWLVDLQFGADAMLVSAFIHVTGGIASNFSSLYLLPDHRGEHDSVAPRGHAGRRAQRSRCISPWSWCNTSMWGCRHSCGGSRRWWSYRRSAWLAIRWPSI